MQILDFNAVQQPEWEIKLRDTTSVTLTAPTERLLERLVAVAGELADIKDKGDENSINAVFSMIAEVMSNNLDGLKFTGESLKAKHKMNFYDAVLFIRQYLVFINEITEAKN